MTDSQPAKTLHVTAGVDLAEVREWAEKFADSGKHGLAQALYEFLDNHKPKTMADAELFAPELLAPGPSIFKDDDTPTWVTPTDTGGRHVVTVRDGEVMDGAVAHSPATARQIGLSWLAAAKEAEGK